jgi:hypothetical protein
MTTLSANLITATTLAVRRAPVGDLSARAGVQPPAWSLADVGRGSQTFAVTTTGEPLTIRPPGWARVLGPVFLVLWLSVFLVRPRDEFLVPAVVIALLAAAVVGRMLLSSVIGTGDGRLTVRNHWSTLTLVRDEIEDVEIDRAGGSGRGWALWLRLTDGTRVRLDVTEAPFLGPFAATLEGQAVAVRTWLGGGSLAYR